MNIGFIGLDLNLKSTKMQEFYYPTLPNFTWLKRDLYIEIFFVLLGLWLCIWLFIFFLIKYRRRKKLHEVLSDIESRTISLDKINFQQKIIESDNQQQVVLFIEYLNKFYKIKPSSDFQWLLSSVWISKKDSDKISEFLYTWKYNPDIQKIIATFLKQEV